MGQDANSQGALPPLPLPGTPVTPTTGDGVAGIMNSILSPGGAPQAAPAGASGHYEFDEAGFNSVLTDITTILTKIGAARQAALPMVQVLPMGDEPSSHHAADGVNNSGKSYLKHNDELRVHFEGLRDSLTKARDAYLAQEQHAAGSINKIQGNM
jgi:hypothetical protein